MQHVLLSCYSWNFAALSRLEVTTTDPTDTVRCEHSEKPRIYRVRGGVFACECQMAVLDMVHPTTEALAFTHTHI